VIVASSSSAPRLGRDSSRSSIALGIVAVVVSLKNNASKKTKERSIENYKEVPYLNCM